MFENDLVEVLLQQLIGEIDEQLPWIQTCPLQLSHNMALLYIARHCPPQRSLSIVHSALQSGIGLGFSVADSMELGI